MDLKFVVNPGPGIGGQEKFARHDNLIKLNKVGDEDLLPQAEVFVVQSRLLLLLWCHRTAFFQYLAIRCDLLPVIRRSVGTYVSSVTALDDSRHLSNVLAAVITLSLKWNGQEG